MQNRILASLVAFFGLSFFVLSAQADETKIPLDQVPAVVKDAVKKKFPDAKMEEAEKEVKDGKTTFESHQGRQQENHGLAQGRRDDPGDRERDRGQGFAGGRRIRREIQVSLGHCQEGGGSDGG